jgi:hypothetical protein
VSCDTTRFSVVDLQSNLWSDLTLLYIEEAVAVSGGSIGRSVTDLLDVMCRSVNRAYATCLWNQIDSSRGSHLALGRIYRNMFLQSGITMTIVSTDNTRPAPREIQTEN